MSNDNLDQELLKLFDQSYEENDSDTLASNPFFSDLKNTSERYKSHKLIASGGMKNIYQVYDIKTGRHLAYATLRDEIPMEANEAFLLEARLTSLLEHPNIISIHDIGISEQNKAYFTMELKVGDSLKQILMKLKANDSTYLETFNLLELLNIFLKICDAISYAHSQNVLHLDLKPGNIQIGPFGEVLVCDWGLGKVLNNEVFEKYEELKLNSDFLNDITLTGEIKGTLGFMSPEQIKSKSSVSYPADIYSLGALLYAILTKTPPVNGSKEQMIQDTLNGNIHPANRLNKHIPESLSLVAQKALSQKATKRYQTVEEMSNDIRKYIRGYSTEAENAGFFKELQYFFKRHKTAVKTSLFFIFLITCSIIIFISNLQQSMKREQVARRLANQETLKAKEAMNMYHTQQEKAEKSLNLLDEQQRLYANRARDRANQLMYLIYRLTDSDIFTEPLKSLDLALKIIDKSIKQNEEAHISLLIRQKGYIHFIRQEFEELIKLNYNFHPLKEIAEQIIEFKQNRKLLSLEDFRNMIKLFQESRYGHYKLILVKMLIYDELIRQNQDVHVELLRELIKVYNPAWDKNNYHYSKKNKSMKLSGVKLISLSTISVTTKVGKKTSYNFLESLELRELNLSNSDFFNLKELASLKIRSLNIANTLVSNLSGLEKMSNLKTLIINKQQFSQAQLNKIPKDIFIKYQ